MSRKSNKSFAPIDIEDVKTVADANRLLVEQCMEPAMTTSYLIFVTGILAYAYMFQRAGFMKRIPFSYEYKLLAGITPIVVGSFSIGIYQRRRCDRKLKEKLREMGIQI